jgi:methionine synthase I (cobalamin-dependent)
VLSAAYDILKKGSADMVWVEAVQDLETAKLRVKQLAAGSHGEYVVFDQRTRKIVANCSAVGRF